MPRQTKTFAQRMAAQDAAEALETVTSVERLLALILMELMQLRGQRDYAEIAARLQVVLSKKQTAALMGSTPASLSALAQRKRRATDATLIEQDDEAADS